MVLIELLDFDRVGYITTPGDGVIMLLGCHPNKENELMD